jgi:hypothetical protein
MVRFVVVKLNHLDLNFRFDIGTVFMVNYSFNKRRIDSEVFLMTNFINLKIKPIQFFRDIHRNRMCIRVFI